MTVRSRPFIDISMFTLTHRVLHFFSVHKHEGAEAGAVSE